MKKIHVKYSQLGKTNQEIRFIAERFLINTKTNLTRKGTLHHEYAKRR